MRYCSRMLRTSLVWCCWYMLQKGSMDDPAAIMMRLDPPGCPSTNSVMSYTPLLYVTQIRSFLVLCFATSSLVYCFLSASSQRAVWMVGIAILRSTESSRHCQVHVTPPAKAAATTAAANRAHPAPEPSSMVAEVDIARSVCSCQCAGRAADATDTTDAADTPCAVRPVSATRSIARALCVRNGRSISPLPVENRYLCGMCGMCDMKGLVATQKTLIVTGVERGCRLRCGVQ
mmetsp:Transcript_14915/g.45019  ORF Transcript_14915/g.45019 Transcript_14915/m.45019 type:complete len:232 (-) Transcript_14915:67-762(-)